MFHGTCALRPRNGVLLGGGHKFGAGSGRLAADLLLELETRAALSDRYSILDLSGELRERQRETIRERAAHLLERVDWLDRLPEHFDGLVLANKLLDAMLVHLVIWSNAEGVILERGVAWSNNAFLWSNRPATGRVLEHAQALTTEHLLPSGYLRALCLAATDWTAAWGDILGKSALLLFDYGFPCHEFYHPQRLTGTLICHYRHQAHNELFSLLGLQDITTHVDFTAIAEADFNAGLDVLGYTAQAN